jgi:hypothetical protein
MGRPVSSDPGQGDDVAGFDGAIDLLRAWSRGIRPDPNLTVSEWADRHRWLSSRASAEPGRYRTARTPYMREIMDALSPASPVQRVEFMKAAQVGAPLALDTPVPMPLGLDDHSRDRRRRSALRRARAHLPRDRPVTGVRGPALLRGGIRRRRAHRSGWRASLAGVGLHERPPRRANSEHGGDSRAGRHWCRRQAAGAMPSTAATRSTCRTRT